MPQNDKRPREERSVGWATECLCLRKNRALRGLSFEDMESPTEIPDKGDTPEEIYDAMVSRAGALWGTGRAPWSEPKRSISSRKTNSMRVESPSEMSRNPPGSGYRSRKSMVTRR